ncbi:MAG: carboxypeptidase-like regulatory domain-containing protein, partial [Blastocatellia bacterium]
MSSLSQNVYRALIVLACLFFCTAPPVAGQVLYGSLVGNVTDASGAAVPGVKVSIKEPGTNLAREATAN